MTAGAPFIAIIDKDRGVRKAVSHLLRAHGFRAQGYASAEAFLLRGRMDAPACLVLDIELDGQSGLALLDRLKTDGLSVPIIVVTAAEDEPTRRSVLEAGCAAYLQKPSSAEELLTAIEKAIRSTVNQEAGLKPSPPAGTS
jgi:FixJ family two-component response regulator